MFNMRILWFLFLVHTTFGQPGFGTSYLRNSRLCHQWSCINKKLALPDSLPTIDQFTTTLRSLLPDNWQNVAETVVNSCYNNRERRYTNTCPGQALLQCTVDQLVNNCPEHSLRKDDACAPVYSLAGGLDYMFSQSRYENMERNIPYERRPSWFLKHYFDSKCCNLPQLFNSTTLTECGFSTMMSYNKHEPKFDTRLALPTLLKKQESPVFQYTTEKSNNGVSLQVVNLDSVKPIVPESNPLNCCDMSELIKPEWTRECGFDLQWSEVNRLVIRDGVNAVSTTPPPVRTVAHRDLMVVPHTCEQETCVFNKLNLTLAGTVDLEGFKKLLDNLTDRHPSWNKAKARVLTACLSKPLKEYEADCEINKVLACVFDVLSENCPLNESYPKTDGCKHSKDDRICQISSSKSRPKNRRSVCVVPDLVDRRVLTECGLSTLHKVEQVVLTTSKHKKRFAWQAKCHDLTPSTSCLMSKMGVMNKYAFIDYFKTKDKIRNFTSSSEWSTLVDVYLGSFSNGPLYPDHCNSAKKLLNVLDTMLMTCPASKRVNTPQCTKLLTEIRNTPSKQHDDQVLMHFHHIFYPIPPPKATSKISKVIKKPIYDYGILSSMHVPKVEVIDVKPQAVKKPEVVAMKPLVLLPVYMRPQSNLMFRPDYQDGLLRTSFNMHKDVYQTNFNTPFSMTAPKPILPPDVSSFVSSSSVPTSTYNPLPTPVPI